MSSTVHFVDQLVTHLLVRALIPHLCECSICSKWLSSKLVAAPCDVPDKTFLYPPHRSEAFLNVKNQWELASILLILTTAWTDRWVEASSPLHILLVSRLSHLSREGSPHQGARKETWSGSFGLKMRWEWVNCAVRVMLKDDSSMQKATAALGMGSPRKSIPKQCTGWRLETEGMWRICTTPLIEKTFNLRKIRLSQLPLTRVPV